MNPALYYGGAVLLGLLVSMLSGALGVGGGLLTTPALRLFLATPPLIALGTTLPATIPTALAGAWRYQKAGYLNRSAFLYSAIFGAGGSLVGAYCTSFFSGSLMMIFTALAILLLGVQMWRQSKVEAVEQGTCSPQPGWKKAAVGLAAGLLSGFLGIGGGLLLVPGYLLVLGMPVKECFGTSLASVVVIAIPGTVVHFLLGHIDPWLALALAVLAWPGSNLGASWALRRKDQRLVRLFAFFLLAVALTFATSEFLQFLH